MCRSIKTLANFEPAATSDEIRAAAVQFVRKLSGCHTPSKANEACFNRAVEEISETSTTLIRSLVLAAPFRNREVERLRVERMRDRGRQGADRVASGSR